MSSPVRLPTEPRHTRELESLLADLDADSLLSEMADDLTYHGDLNAALRRMLQQGFRDRNGESLMGLREMLEPALPLLLALGVITGLVALAVNPWRSDKLPDRFPNILQDTVVIVAFAIAATLILQERIFATTAAVAVVIGANIGIAK